MKNKLILQTKKDIPFIEAQVQIHQPTIAEISLIGEEEFRKGCQLLIFSKDSLKEEEKALVADKTDFEIFMSIINEKQAKEFKNNVKLVLSLLFPEYNIIIEKEEIILQKEAFLARLNKLDYDAFKDIIIDMLCIENADGGDGKYNPANGMARKIAEKFKKAEQRKNKGKGANENLSLYALYISDLSVGLGKDKNDFANYTIPQLTDEFERFQKKVSYDIYIQAKMAGATNLEEVDNWMM